MADGASTGEFKKLYSLDWRLDARYYVEPLAGELFQRLEFAVEEEPAS